MSNPDPMGFTVALREEGRRIVVVELAGELDLFIAPDLRAALDPLLDGRTSVCVDLRAVPFVDTTALAVLLRARRALRDRGASFALAGPVPTVAAALDRAGLGELLRRYDTPEEAVRAFADEADAEPDGDDGT